MAQGQIRKIVRDRGFGFILPQGGGKDVFFHCSALEGIEIEALQEGQTVEFEVRQDTRGPRAVNVRLVTETGA